MIPKEVLIHVDQIEERNFGDGEKQDPVNIAIQEDILLNGVLKPVVLYKQGDIYKVFFGFTRVRIVKYNPEVKDKYIPAVIVSMGNDLYSTCIRAAAHLGLHPLANIADLQAGKQVPKLIFHS
jgi:hypothetical protein